MTVWKWSTSAGSNGNIDSTINFSEGQAPSTLNDSNRAMMAAIRKYANDISGGTITSTGSANTYAVTTEQGLTSLTDGFQLAFKANVANTGASTINVDGRGARALRSVSGANLTAGEITAGSVYTIVYEASGNEWLIHGGLRTTSSGGGGSTPTFSSFGTTWVNLADASAARSNLSLGTAALETVGTSGTVVGRLDGNNTHSGNLTFSGTNTYSGVNTFSNAAGVPAKNTAKAFGRCAAGGSGVAGFNCTATNGSTGQYTFTFTTAMSGTSYTVVVGIEDSTASSVRVPIITSKSTSSVTVRVNNASGTAADPSAVCITVFE